MKKSVVSSIAAVAVIGGLVFSAHAGWFSRNHQTSMSSQVVGCPITYTVGSLIGADMQTVPQSPITLGNTYGYMTNPGDVMDLTSVAIKSGQYLGNLYCGYQQKNNGPARATYSVDTTKINVQVQEPAGPGWSGSSGNYSCKPNGDQSSCNFLVPTHSGMNTIITNS